MKGNWARVIVKSIASVSCFLLIHSLSFAQHFTDLVNPYIGTAGHAHVFLGASVPFGAVQLGPDNIFRGWDWCSGYNYTDSIIKGFSHTHLSGTGMPDLGDVMVQRYAGNANRRPFFPFFSYKGMGAARLLWGGSRRL
jgi:putative alpha-1,2-mannosidase